MTVIDLNSCVVDDSVMKVVCTVTDGVNEVLWCLWYTGRGKRMMCFFGGFVVMRTSTTLASFE